MVRHMLRASETRTVAHSPWARQGRRARAAWLLLLVLGLVTAACGDDGADPPSTSNPQADGNGVVHTFVALDAGGPLTKEALSSGEIDVAVLFTSSADEAAYDFVRLEDDRGLQPVENFIPAVRSEILDARIAETLNAVSAVLTTESIQSVVARVDDGEAVSDVAAALLDDAGLPGANTSPGDGLFALTVGSASFPESLVVGEIYTQALLGAGIEAVHTPDLGFREVYFPALEAGDLDIVPEFVGSLLTHLEGSPTSELGPTVDDLESAVAQRGIAVLEPAPAQSQNGFYLRAANADQMGLTTITDLTTVDHPIIFGGPAECPERPLCLAGLREVYGLEFDV